MAKTMKNLEGVETAELRKRRARLDEELAAVRRGPKILGTRAGAHARLDETFVLCVRAITEREVHLRHRLATTGGPLPTHLVAELHSMIEAHAGTLRQRLHDVVDRPLLRTEADPFTAEPATVPRARDVVEAELAVVTVELERRELEDELAQVDQRRAGLLQRIGGRR